jgi:hypothetical protein
MFTYASFAILCGVAGILNVNIVLLLIAAQSISWLVSGTLMCAVFDSLGNPPPPPKERVKETSKTTKMKGNSGITEVERIKTYKY